MRTSLALSMFVVSLRLGLIRETNERPPIFGVQTQQNGTTSEGRNVAVPPRSHTPLGSPKKGCEVSIFGPRLEAQFD